MLFLRVLPTVLLAGAALLAGCSAATLQTEAAPPVEAAPAEVPAAAAEPAKERELLNRVKWRTASEVDNFGYDVYRGESPEGPFERINPEVIEGAGTTDEPTSYEFVDRDIDPRRGYYYYVESISMNGVRERFTPVGFAKPKIESKSPDEEGEDQPDSSGGESA